MYIFAFAGKFPFAVLFAESERRPVDPDTAFYFNKCTVATYFLIADINGRVKVFSLSEKCCEVGAVPFF
ncbi:hypothetical protein [Leptolyngbya sp. 7M]|uniref:hypothetical protein n=1 Tax=Leptolyngbya sp. 7M TaxID=2812896 RepID=UPI001B8CF848|nr:hypothetical protein [Leptolyngbya sp. 7M]QYO66699.1 hypothetical protein JVX88_07820 [Leptolyngbya sp. 7M]